MKVSQVVCELIGFCVEFSISKLLILKYKGNSIGCPFNLRLKQCMNGLRLAKVNSRVVPFMGNLVNLSFG